MMNIEDDGLNLNTNDLSSLLSKSEFENDYISLTANEEIELQEEKKVYNIIRKRSLIGI